MMSLFGRSVSIVIMISIALHLFWAVAILVNVAAVNATGLHAISLWFPPVIPAVTALTLSSLCSIVAMWLNRPWMFLLFLPQQTLLMLSASGSLEAMWLGQFADGVLRSHIFIFSDQISSVLLAFGHTIAIIVHAARWRPA